MSIGAPTREAPTGYQFSNSKEVVAPIGVFPHISRKRELILMAMRGRMCRNIERHI